MKRLLLLFLVSATVASAQEVVSGSVFAGGEGVNGEVNAIAVQGDGKIVIGGRFTTVNGQPRNNIARINADGTLDGTFAASIEAGVNGQVYALAAQPKGGVIVGGAFTQAGGSNKMNVARYNADGSIDDTFTSGDGYPGTNGPVMAVSVQSDGKVLIGGNFNTIFGHPRRGLARLNADGSLDNPLMMQNALSGQVNAVAASSQGAALAGGQFTMQNQTARNLFRQPMAK